MMNVGFSMRGLITAMNDTCGDSVMCRQFTSLTSQEADEYYQAVQFDTLRYAGDLPLPFVHEYQDHKQKDSYAVIWQEKIFPNGSQTGMGPFKNGICIRIEFAFTFANFHEIENARKP